MKQLIFATLVLIANLSFASKADSTFQRHQISFSITNATSIVPEIWVDFGTTDGVSSTPYYPYDRHLPTSGAENFYHSTVFIPNYSLHLKLEYSLGLSNAIRLETGAGYLLQGLTIKYNLPDANYSTSSLTYCYIGNLAIPLHIKILKKKSKATWTYTFGPNVTFPFHDVYKTTDVMIAGVRQASNNGRQLFHSFTDNSSFGFDLKIGYEKQLNKDVTLNIGPVIYCTQIYWFNYRKMDSDGQIPISFFQSYIGFDLAFIIDMKSK